MKKNIFLTIALVLCAQSARPMTTEKSAHLFNYPNINFQNKSPWRGKVFFVSADSEQDPTELEFTLHGQKPEIFQLGRTWISLIYAGAVNPKKPIRYAAWSQQAGFPTLSHVTNKYTDKNGKEVVIERDAVNADGNRIAPMITAITPENNEYVHFTRIDEKNDTNIFIDKDGYEIEPDVKTSILKITSSK